MNAFFSSGPILNVQERRNEERKMPRDHEGEIDNHFIAVNQGDLPRAWLERAKGGMKERGGQADRASAGAECTGCRTTPTGGRCWNAPTTTRTNQQP